MAFFMGVLLRFITHQLYIARKSVGDHLEALAAGDWQLVV
jgi:hypothetical protein